MKIEKLTENKIRIILNIDELAKRNIDFHTLMKDTNSAQKLFKKILKQAEKEVGFDASDSKLLIEAFISTEGFFVITFTKISNQINSKNIDIKSSTLRVRRKIPSTSSSNAIYQFNTFEEFCKFCTYLENSPLKDLNGFAKNILLYEYKSNYFLVFSDINTNYKNINLFYSSISEFAKLFSNSIYFKSELLEYGKIILKNNAIKNGIKYSVHF